MKKSIIIIGVIVIIAVFFLSINSINTIKKTQTTDFEYDDERFEEQEEIIKEVPIELSIPFNVEDIGLLKGEVNPLGVVRFELDQGDIGHSGIDIPLKQGSPIYAVADGPVVITGSAGDPWNGEKLFQLLQETSKGEGLAFIYEHIEIGEGIVVGTELKKGEIIGTKIPPDSFTAHFQLSQVFNDFQYTSDNRCWPDFLSSNEKSILDSWWVE